MATDTSTAARESTAADEGTETRTAVQKLREQADAVVERIQPQIAAVSTYVRDEPTKALLISAAAGAALMGLFALIVRSSGRSQVPGASAGRSAMAAIRDAALDLAESAQTMALDALEATRTRAPTRSRRRKSAPPTRSARPRSVLPTRSTRPSSAPRPLPTASPNRSPTRGRRCATRPRRWSRRSSRRSTPPPLTRKRSRPAPRSASP